MIEVYV